MMGRFKHLKLFACLLVFVLSMGLALIVKPQAALADNLPNGDSFNYINYKDSNGNTHVAICEDSSSNPPCSQSIDATGSITSLPNSAILYNLVSGSDEFENHLPAGTDYTIALTASSNGAGGICGQGAYQAVATSGSTANAQSATIKIDNLSVLTGADQKTIGCSVPASEASQNGPSTSTSSSGVTGVTSASGTSGTGATGSSDTTPTCQSSAFSLSWIMCPIIQAVADAEQNFESLIGKLLTTQPVTFSAADCSNPKATDYAGACIFSVWSSFRTYGDIALVIALLAVVFAEAAGGGLIDAYTAKKMLPRILIAAILINLSIYIVAALEDIANILGHGLYALISDPFKAAGTWHITLNGIAGDAAGLGLFGTLLVGTLAIPSIWKLAKSGKAAIDAVVALAFMVGLPVLLAILGVVLTIMFRTGLLVLLVMVSPIAFALYVLPNTEQFFKRWWKLLFEVLLVYPILVLIFVMADITGIVMSSFNVQPDWLGQLMGVAAIIAPLFLVPFAFRFAGSTMSAVHEGVTNFRKRAHGAIKGDERDPASMQNKMKSKLNMTRSTVGLSSAAIGERVGGFLPGKKNIYTRKGRVQLAGALATRKNSDLGLAGQQYLEADKVWQQYKEDSKFTMAVGNRGLATQRRDEAARKGNYEEVTQWQQALDNASMIHSSAGTRMAATQAWLASGYDLNENGQQAYNEMARTFADITGAGVRIDTTTGNVTGFTGANADAAIGAMNTAQSAMARNGQFHLAGINYGTGYEPDKGLDKADIYTWGRSKPGSATGARDSALAHIAAAPTARTPAETEAHLKKASIYKQELRALSQSATGAQRDEAMRAYRTLEANAALSSWESAAVLAPGGGPPPRVTYNERFRAEDFTGATRADQEAAAMGAGWTANDIARGERIVTRNRTNADIAAEEARISRIPREDE